MSLQRHYGVNEQLERIANAIAMGNAGTSAVVLDETFEAMVNGENTSSLFHRWWVLAMELDNNTSNRYAILDRWFALLGRAWSDKYYTIRFNDYRVSSSSEGTPMGDLAGKAAAMCATEQSANTAEWCDEDPMTWYVRFNALSLADGTMNVVAVEGVDDSFDITGNAAPVYTGSIALWLTQYTDGTYEYKTFTTEHVGGAHPLACDVAPDGSHRHMSWHATFGGSLTSGGKLTSGSGYHGMTWERNSNTPAWREGATTGLTNARKWDSYEGVYSDTDLDHLLNMWQLRHFSLENSGVIEGCLSNNYQYTVAMAEEDVTSFMLTTAQAANLVVGDCVEIGSHPEGTNNDRNTAANYDLVSCAVITEIETVTIDGTDYARVHLDITTAVDIPATGYVSTMPWVPGSTEHLPGRKDGSMYNCTNGKTPARIAGIEIIDGAYALGLDPLWNSDWDDTRDPKSIYTVYQCRNSEKQGGSITSDYESVGTFSSPASGWQYIKHFGIRDDGMMIPDALGASSTTYLRSAFLFAGSSGVRAPWRFCSLGNGARGGLAGAVGDVAPSSASWNGRPRLSGSGKKRGEWAA